MDKVRAIRLLTEELNRNIQGEAFSRMYSPELAPYYADVATAIRIAIRAVEEAIEC